MSSVNNIDLQSYLPVNWPVKPVNVQAFTTLRSGGVSSGDYSEFNLATHVGDDLLAVKSNRKKMCKDLALPTEPVWLEQVHSNKVFSLDKTNIIQSSIQADASITCEKGVVCAVLTADCLPVFFCNNTGTEVAVAHAGWRGLHAGIISNTVKAMFSSAEDILVSLGPAIGPKTFEVGDEVYRAFVDKNAINQSAFVAVKKGHYLCDIYQLARYELQALGVCQITGGEHCTYSEGDQFYSYRKQQNTGRMANLIWIQ